MKIKIDKLQSLLEKAAQTAVNKESAHYITRKIIQTHLRKDNRVQAIKDFVDGIEKLKTAKIKKPTLVKKSKATRLYNLNKLPGLPFLKDINDEIVSLARNYGIGAIGLRNSGGIHTLETWVIGLAEKNCIGIFTWNGGPYAVAPYGSREAFWGTNPIAYAIPTDNDPIILDMATSEIPFRDWVSAKVKKEKLSPKSAFNNKGEFTTNPDEVFGKDQSYGGLATMGAAAARGYKGSGITLLIEIITGALVGAKMGREATLEPIDWSEFGGLLLCLDIASFANVDNFKHSVSLMAEQIRSSKPLPKVTKVRLPGDQEYERMEKALKENRVEVDKDAFQRLSALIKY